MARFAKRRLLLALTSLLAAIAAAGGVALAASGQRHPRRGLPLQRVVRAQGRPGSSRVIVILKNQYRDLPASRRLIRARRSALASSQRPLEASIRRSGGSVHYSYSVLNGFAATVSKAEAAKLRDNPAVAQIIPDATVSEPSQSAAPSGGAAYNDKPATRHLSLKRYDAARAADSAQQVCPANPADPIVAPEGLGLIDAPQAQALGVDGSGVKVAFVADGLDIDNPDFIRPDGQHVITDYRDFSGDGTNTQSGGGEAFGDASTIAAQGNVTYDLSKFQAPGNTLPAGCNIKIEGVAPGSSLVAMKVFGASAQAFTSTIIQGMNWAVADDHVNVLNESFGSDDLPDTTEDVTKLFNRQATAAGVLVTSSSGDQGTANTIGSPASDSDVGGGEISVGSTTQFQGLAQTTRGAIQLGSGGWLNDNIANFSSSGFTQLGTTVDLVAPGNESFEPCTANADLYADCVNLAGQPSNIGTFGGTSESSPFTAGVAALVIQAYRQSHDGQSPSPQLIRSIILSNTTDLTIPSDEQGAGELNALAAVRAAISVNGSHKAGSGRLISPNQLDFAARPGSNDSATVRVSNEGAGTETYTPSLRMLGDAKLTDVKADIDMTPASDPTFLDYKGVAQGYQTVTFKVPAGAQRIDASIAHPGDGSGELNMSLFDPEGRLAAYTYQSAGEPANFGHIDVRAPQAGTWRAVIFTPVSGDNSVTGTAHYEISTSRFDSTGSVSPSSLRLAPGQTGTVHVSLKTPRAPGDYSRDLVISDSSGNTSVVPIVARSLVSLRGGSGTFSGAFTGGDGDGFPADEENFAFDVPRGAPIVHLELNLPDGTEPVVFGFLTSPDGQTLATSIIPQPSGAQVIGVTQRRPEPGRWTFTAVVENPVGGTAVSVPFTGSVSLEPFPIKVSGVPDGRHATIASGASTTAQVTVTNAGNTDLQLFLDPRLHRRQLYPLSAITQPTGVALPLSLSAPPEFLVPTETNLLEATAQASAPITVDWGFGDPDLLMASHGDSASGTFSAPEVTPGIWSITPALTGPIAPDGQTGTVDTGLVGRSRVFDSSVSSPPGDPLLIDVDPNADPGSPIDLAPGQTTTVPVTFTAGATPGSTVSGDLFVDDYQLNSGSANEVGAIPYRYRVGH